MSLFDAGKKLDCRGLSFPMPTSSQAHDAGISKFDFNDDRELVATVSHV